ncbi:MAG: ATP-dependent DNA helicase [Planctomycetota bacterium]
MNRTRADARPRLRGPVQVEPITLNDQQRLAVEHTGGPLAVLAGPGTGKTRVIVARTVRLVREGVEPERILNVTFTSKAAGEMRDRLASHLGPAISSRINVSTFHALGNRLLRRFGDILGLPSELVLIDSAQRTRLLRELILRSERFASAHRNGIDRLADRAASFIDRCKESARFPEEAIDFARAWRETAESSTGDDAPIERADATEFERMAHVYRAFDRACAERGWVTFDDFITLPIRLLRAHVSIAEVVRTELRHVIVDEYQDVNGAQIALLRELAPPASNPDLCVVGDDDQAIYAFRGSDPRAFATFREFWSSHELVELTINHRSAPAIVRAANTIIEPAGDRFSPDKRAEPDPDRDPLKDTGAGVELRITGDWKTDHAPAIAALVLQDRAASDRAWRDFAVITSTNPQCDLIADELRTHGIPVDRREQRTPASDAGVQDVLAWCAVLADPGAADAFTQRLLVRPPIGMPPDEVQAIARAHRTARKADGSTPELARWVEREHPSDERVQRFAALRKKLLEWTLAEPADLVIEQIVRELDPAHTEPLDGRARARRVRDLIAVVAFARTRQRFLPVPGRLPDFLAHYRDLDPKQQETFDAPGDERLDADAEAEDRPDAVSVITAHSSKGLEFDTVFLANVRYRGFPLQTRNDEAGVRIPTEFSGRIEQAHENEQRRLFYVACTRAERRLVLLAKHKKSRGKSLDFTQELQDAADAIGLEEGDVSALLESDLLAPRPEHDPEAWHAGTDSVRAALSRESRRQRERALSVLHDAARGTGELDTIESRLRSSARVLRALAKADPSLLDAPGIDEGDAQRARSLIESIAAGAAPAVTSPMRAPLHLSYSRLMDYNACPRCFYVKHVLRLDEAKTAQLASGSVVHDALEAFTKRWLDAEAEGTPRPTLDDLLDSGDTALQRATPFDQPVDGALRAESRERLRTAFEGFVDDGDQIIEVEQSRDIPYTDADGTAHRLVAKIDRIDRLASGAFRIVDYKTGRASNKLLEPKPDDLQMGIYTLALMDLFGFDEPPDGHAEYRVLSTGERGAIALRDVRLDKVRASINKAVAGMLTGAFPAKPDSDYCKGLCALLPD